MRGKQARKTFRRERIRNHHRSNRLRTGSLLHRHRLSAVRNLIQCGRERFRIFRKHGTIFVGIIFSCTRNRHLNKRSGNRRKNRAQQHAQQSKTIRRRAIAIVTRIATTEIHERIAKIRNDRRHCGRDRRRQDIVIVHVHKLVPKYAANLAFVQHLQNTLRAADRRMTFIASRCERIGAHGWGDINTRHRLARLRRQFAHDFVQYRRFLLADFLRMHGCNRKFVGKPVGCER